MIVSGVFFYAFWSSLAKKEYFVVPEMFWRAHGEGNIIAEEFVALSKTAQGNLEKIRELETKGRTEEALNLIREEIRHSGNLQVKGTELLESLSQMTYSLGGIRPSKARAVAYEAITFRVEMINNLIAYSGELEHILRLLTSRVLYGDDIRNVLEEKIGSANKNARRVNELNKKFNEAIQKLENF